MQLARESVCVMGGTPISEPRGPGGVAPRRPDPERQVHRVRTALLGPLFSFRPLQALER